MSLYVITKQNGLGNGFRPGTWVECFDDGCQRCKVETVDNRLRVVGHEGLIMPLSELRPFMMRPLKRGLDK